MKTEKLSVGNTFNYLKDHSTLQGKIYCINYTTVTIGSDIERHTVKIDSLIPIKIDHDYLYSIGGLYIGDEEVGYNWSFDNPDTVLFDRDGYYEINSYSTNQSIKLEYVHEVENIFKFFFGVIAKPNK